MTEQEALIAAILAEPAEDTPRLAYADWLDEHDEHELAEFIRVQVEVARGKCEVHENTTGCAKGRSPWCDWCLLGLRERELLGGDRLTFLGQPTIDIVDPYYGRSEMSWEFRRGFMADLTCTWYAWRTHAAAITARQPIERVRLTTGPGAELGIRLWEHQQELTIGILRQTWPKIEFELPPADLWAHHVEEYTEVGPEELLRRMREAMETTEFQSPVASPARAMSRAVRRASRRARRP